MIFWAFLGEKKKSNKKEKWNKAIKIPEKKGGKQCMCGCPRLEAREIGGKRDMANTITFLPIINFDRLYTNVPAEVSSLGVCA